MRALAVVRDARLDRPRTGPYNACRLSLEETLHALPRPRRAEPPARAPVPPFVTRDTARAGGRPAARTVAESATEMAQLVLPHEANVHGTVLGGTVMHWIDLAAAVAANRHCRRPVVTAAIDDMAFLAPIRVGQLALLRARLTQVGESSMEIRVDVDSEDLLSGRRRHTSTAYVTFVALDPETGRPTAVPPLELTSDAERAEHALAEERRGQRLARREAAARASRGAA